LKLNDKIFISSLGPWVYQQNPINRFCEVSLESGGRKKGVTWGNRVILLLDKFSQAAKDGSSKQKNW